MCTEMIIKKLTVQQKCEGFIFGYSFCKLEANK